MTTIRKPRTTAFASCTLSVSPARSAWATGDLPFLAPVRPPLSHARQSHPRRACITALQGRRTAVAEYIVSPTAGAVSTRVDVEIFRPAADIRLIRACVLVNAGLEVVWSLLADYGTLSEHIPNLAESAILSQRPGRARVSQCGVQNILGFTFKASVTMDMREVQPDSSTCRAIEFGLVESRDFKKFHGVWKADRVAHNRTALYYDVTVSPRGLVPVRAIEWRISEDVPGNLEAVKRVCEARQRVVQANARRGVRNGGVE